MQVKSIVSGDSIVIRRNGSDALVSMYGIAAPAKDDAWYFEAKDFTRKLLMDKKIVFKSLAKTEKEVGTVLLKGDDVAKIIVQNGWASVCNGVAMEELVELEKLAKSQKLGMHSSDAGGIKDLKEFLDKNEILGTKYL